MANASTLKAQRTTLEKLIGTTDFEYMGAERAQWLMDQEQHLMETGEAIINQELFVPADITETNLSQWFLVTKVPVYDDQGECVGLVGINRDITALKFAAQRETELELERERSKVLADFITDTSHEFRTPISIIQTSLHLLKNADAAEKQEKHTQSVINQVNRLKDLVESLITMSRLDQQKTAALQPILLSQTIRILIDRTQSTFAAKKLHIDQICEDESLKVAADAVLLDTALGNILNNAIQYTPHEGKITIKTRIHGGHVIIEICDSGIGMSEEIMAQIFRRFYRADQMHTTSGFGLGLPMTQRIIELHHGTVEVESKPDEGSIFRVVLPGYTP